MTALNWGEMNQLQSASSRGREFVSWLMFVVPFSVILGFFAAYGFSMFKFRLDEAISLASVGYWCMLVVVIRELMFFEWTLRDLIELLVVLAIANITWSCDMVPFSISVLFVYAARNVELRQVMAISAAVVTFAIIVVVICANTGILPNVVFDINPSERARYYLGFFHANNGSMLAFGAAGAAICALGRRFDFKFAIAIAIPVLVVFHFTYTRTLLVALIALVVLALAGNRIPRSITESRAIAWCVGAVPIAFSLFIYLSIANYDPGIGWMDALNKALSGRLHYGHLAYVAAPPDWFGQQADLPTYWAREYVDGDWIPYERPVPVDSFFMQIPQSCGLLVTVFIVALFALASMRLFAQRQMCALAAVLTGLAYASSEYTAATCIALPALLYLGQAFNVGKPLPEQADETKAHALLRKKARSNADGARVARERGGQDRPRPHVRPCPQTRQASSDVARQRSRSGAQSPRSGMQPPRSGAQSPRPSAQGKRPGAHQSPRPSAQGKRPVERERARANERARAHGGRPAAQVSHKSDAASVGAPVIRFMPTVDEPNEHRATHEGSSHDLS